MSIGESILKKILYWDESLEYELKFDDFLSSKSLALIYDNIEYNSYRGLLKADNIHYDLQEKILKISMNDDKKIKMKLIK